MSEKKKTILVVEDETPLLKIIQDSLEKGGFHVIATQSVDEAIKRLEKGPAPDAVWLDHYLPGRNGTELVTFMKKDESPYKEIPIFLVSNTAGAEKIYNYITMGVRRYYVKSDHRLDKIVAELKEFLDSEEK